MNISNVLLGRKLDLTLKNLGATQIQGITEIVEAVRLEVNTRYS